MFAELETWIVHNIPSVDNVQNPVIAIAVVIVCVAVCEAIGIMCFGRANKKLPKYKLIGLSGKFGVGKDTAAEWIMQRWPVYQSVPFADALKRVVAVMTCTSYESQFTREGKAHVPPGYKESVGRYQQILGQLGREHFREDVWVNIALKHPAEYKIIPDVRHPNEADAIRDAGGIVIRIVRDGITLNDGRDPNHISETALDKYNFSNVICNNASLEIFKRHLMLMLEE